MRANYRLVRLVRTASSEVYLAWSGETRIAQIDLHYTDGLAHATVVLDAALERSVLEALVNQIDEDIVSSTLPPFDREDLFVTVYTGQEVLHLSDGDDMDGLDDSDLDDDEDEPF